MQQTRHMVKHTELNASNYFVIKILLLYTKKKKKEIKSQNEIINRKKLKLTSRGAFLELGLNLCSKQTAEREYELESVCSFIPRYKELIRKHKSI